MARRHRMTPRRRAALRKAQLASAKKRSRGISKKKAVIGTTLALAGGAAAVYGTRKHSTIRRKQAAIADLSGKQIRLTLTRTVPRTGQYSSSGIARSGIGVLNVHHPSRQAGIRVSSIGGMGISTGTLTGTRTRSINPIDRDSIPLYKPGNSKSWPSVGAKQARRNNRKMRKEGLIE